MADLMDAQAEIQEVMGQTFATPDGLDEDELLGELDALDAEIKSKLGNATVAHLPAGRKITWRSSKREGFFVGPKTVRVLKVPTLKE